MRTSQSPKTARNSTQSNSTTQTTENNVMTANAAQTDKPATTLTAEVVKTLAGTPLQAAYLEVLGTEPKPKTPVPLLRSRIIAALEKRAAEEAAARTAGEAAHEAAVEMIEEAAATEAQPEAPAAEETTAPTDANEAAMRAAREAVAAGADAKACSDLLGLLEDGTIDSVAFHKGLETEVAAARAAAEPPAEPAVAQDAPVAAPAPVIAPTPEDAAQGPDGANTPAPADTKDAIDMLLDRARTIVEPAALDAFLAATPAKDLRLAVGRLTGQKTSGRLSPSSAVARIKQELAAEKAEATKIDEPADAAQSGDTAQPGDATAEHETNDAAAAEPSRDTASATTGDEHERQLPPVGTILIKRDRHGAERCRCTILEGGKIEYAGKEYGSLSAAGLASAKDLGLTTSTIDGWSWWGLKTKQTPAPSRTKKPTEIDFDAIDKAWDRYRSRVEEALKAAGADDADKLRKRLLAHAEAIFALAQPAATPATVETEAA